MLQNLISKLQTISKGTELIIPTYYSTETQVKMHSTEMNDEVFFQWSEKQGMKGVGTIGRVGQSPEILMFRPKMSVNLAGAKWVRLILK